MTESSVQLSVSCEPHTIWRLDEGDRPVATIVLFKQCAEQFRDAVDRDDAGAAQDMAISALGSVGGLFPDPNDSAHVLLHSLVGMIVAAKAGRSKHILQRSTSPILGTKGGFGHSLVGGFAISAVQALTSRNLLSDRQARIRVARLLAEFGCSLRNGDHSEPKPISDGAIRNWRDRPQDFPLHNAMAAEMASIHTENLTRRKAVTLDDVLAYLRPHAQDTIRLSRAY